MQPDRQIDGGVPFRPFGGHVADETEDDFYEKKVEGTKVKEDVEVKNVDRVKMANVRRSQAILVF